MRVRSLKCRGCEGVLTIPHGTEEAQCLHCGRTCTLEEALNQERSRGRQFPHTTPVRLGMKCHYRGREYEATGRVVLRERHDEGYSDWEEWYLVSADGDLLYLEYDEGKWKISEPYVPEVPLSPQELTVRSEGDAVELDGRLVGITSRGKFEVMHAEGEFPWAIHLGKPAEYADLEAGSRFYSVEWSEDEIEYFRGEYLKERGVLTMFNLYHLVTAMDRREVLLRSRRVFGGAALLVALLAFCFWGYAQVSGAPVPGATGTAQVSQIRAAGQRFGPYRLTAQNRVHRLEVSGGLREQSAWVQAVLEDAQERELMGVDREMWDESGHDSDGYWHESDVYASTDFVVRQPGDYYVRLYAEPETAASSSASVRFTLRERVLYPAYMVWLGFLMLLVGVGFLFAGSPTGSQRIWERLSSS